MTEKHFVGNEQKTVVRLGWLGLDWFWIVVYEKEYLARKWTACHLYVNYDQLANSVDDLKRYNFELCAFQSQRTLAAAFLFSFSILLKCDIFNIETQNRKCSEFNREKKTTTTKQST